MIDNTFLQGLALLETQDGAKSIKGPNGEDSFNLFNIKDFSGKGGFKAHDKAEGSRDAYRVYGSREESIQDLLGLLQRKYPDALKAQTGEEFAAALKKGGYATDPLYVSKLTGAIKRAQTMRASETPAPAAQPALDKPTTTAVQNSVINDENAVGQLVELRKNGWGADVDAALANGWKPQEIVARIAGEQVKEAQAAKDRRDTQSFVSNVGDKLANEGSDAVLAAKQIFSSGADEAALRSEAQARRDDLDRRALDATAGGKVGGAIPAVAAGTAAAVATGGAALPLIAGQVAAGGLVGAARPTVADGERTQNVLTDAALGGVGAAVPVGIAKAGGAALRSVGGLARGGQTGEQVAAQLAEAERLGIPVSAADISPTYRAIGDAAGNVPFAKALGGASTEQGQTQAMAREIAKRFGQEATTLDSSVIAKAQTSLGKNFDDALSGVSIKPSTAFTSELDSVLGAEAKKLPSLQNTTVKNIVGELKAAASEPIAASQLQGMRSDIGKQMLSTSLEPGAKQALGEVSKAIENELKRGLPAEKLALWKQTNDQWRHLQAAENLVRLTNDTGELTARKLASAIKQSQFKTQFERGQAPYQDLLKAFSGLSEPARESADAGLLKMGSLGYMAHNPLAALAIPVAAGARRLVNSTNPMIRNAMLGVPSDASSAAQGLAGALAARSEQTQVPVSQTPQAQLAAAMAQRATQAVDAAGLSPAPTPNFPPAANDPTAQAKLREMLAFAQMQAQKKKR